ncbi:MAG: DUF418 domain-containing protein [Pseudomonadota bacterium]
MMTDTAPSRSEALGPLLGADRITAIDTLRGVAVLGILVMNIYAFAMPFAAYQNPLLLGGTEWYNLGTWFFTHVFFDQKFMTIFSMLFGAGLIVMWQRAQARDAPFSRIYLRRQLWLAAIGIVHGYLLWVGDILFHYAVIGLLAFTFRTRQPRTLIIIACCLLAVAPLLSVGTAAYVDDLRDRIAVIDELAATGETLDNDQLATQDEWREIGKFVAPSRADLQRDLDAHRGGYRDVLAFRAPTVVSMQTEATFFFVLWRVGGVMLLGMALMKLGILAGTRSERFYRRMQLMGYGLGLPLTIFSAYDLFSHQWDGVYVLGGGMLSNYVGSILVAFGHVATVMRIVNANLWPRLMARFTAVGRMALTNYLLHSIVLTTIFYGYGLGLYGAIPRAWQMAFVVLVLGLQLWLSPIWLRHYRFGPLEWAWRSLTYWRRQPLRRA